MKLETGQLGKTAGGTARSGWAARATSLSWLWLWAGSLLTLLAGLGVWRLDLQTDLAQLLPEDDPAVQAYLSAQRLFAAESVVLMLEDLEGSIDPGLAQPLADMASELPALAHAGPLPFQLDGLLRELSSQALILVPPENRAALLHRLSPEGMEEAVGRLRRRLQLPLSGAASELLRTDPLGLSELLLAPDQRSELPWQLAEGSLLSADGRALLVFAELADGASDEAQLGDLRRSLESLQQRFQSYLLSAGIDPSGLRLRATGPAVIAAEEARLLRRETLQSFLLSLLLVVCFFALAFRRLAAFLWLALPLAGAVLCTLMIGHWLGGPLSALAAAAAVPMVGLGVDFGVHLYSRALDRRAEGWSPRQAMARALDEVSGANLPAAASTGLAFASLAASSIPGLGQLGWLSALGLLLSLVSMSLFFPAMLLAAKGLGADNGSVADNGTVADSGTELDDGITADDQLATDSRGNASRRSNVPRPYTVPGRWLEPWLELLSKHRRKASLLLTLLAIACLFCLPRLRYGEGHYASRLAVNQALQAQGDVLQRFGSHFRAGVLLLSSQDPKALEQTARDLLAAAEDLRNEGSLQLVLSPLAWLPAEEEQRETRRALAQLGEPEALVQQLRRHLANAGLSPAAFSPGLQHLGEGLLAAPLGLHEWAAQSDLAAAFWRRQAAYPAGRDPGSEQGAEHLWLTPIYLLPTDQNYGDASVDHLEQRLAQVPRPDSVQANLVTPRQLSRALRGAARGETLPLALLALACVLVVLSLSLRRARWVVVAVLPLALATLATLATVALLGIPLSVENLAAMPLILGIGIDDALHVLHALRRHPARSAKAAVRDAGKAVAVTTVTTVLAFAALVFAGHPALASLGLITGLGVTYCLFTTLTVIPLAAPWLRPGQSETGLQEPVAGTGMAG